MIAPLTCQCLFVRSQASDAAPGRSRKEKTVSGLTRGLVQGDFLAVDSILVVRGDATGAVLQKIQ